MAYNQSASYEPPHRPYYGHAPSPAQHQYGEYAAGPYGQEEQQYTQQYDDQYGQQQEQQYDAHQYDQRYAQQQYDQRQYDQHGYDQHPQQRPYQQDVGYSSHNQQEWSTPAIPSHSRDQYANREDAQYGARDYPPQQQQGRSYDPRYQPRAPRGPPQGLSPSPRYDSDVPSAERRGPQYNDPRGNGQASQPRYQQQRAPPTQQQQPPGQAIDQQQPQPHRVERSQAPYQAQSQPQRYEQPQQQHYDQPHSQRFDQPRQQYPIQTPQAVRPQPQPQSRPPPMQDPRQQSRENYHGQPPPSQQQQQPQSPYKQPLQAQSQPQRQIPQSPPSHATRPTYDQHASTQSSSRTQRNDWPASPASGAIEAKQTMAEWKAKEKARMHADANKPEILAQDNAFPSFPNVKKKERSAVQDRSGGNTAMSNRSSDERRRPQTSGSLHPAPSREHNTPHESVSSNNSLPTVARPGMERSASSGDLTKLRQAPRQHSPPKASPRLAHDAAVDSQPPAEYVSSPHEHSEHWPLADTRQPVKAQSPQMSPRRPHDSGPGPGYPANPRPMQDVQDKNQSRSSNDNYQRPSERAPRGPPASMQPIDISKAQHQERPRYETQAVSSPVNAASRPPPSQNARTSNEPRVTSPLASPLSMRGPAQSPAVQSPYNPSAQAAHKPWMQPVRAKDVSDGGGATTVNDASVRPPQTRDEEIEAEMPNFDTAAPTVSGHKRNQTVDRDLAPAPEAEPAPPMPTAPKQFTGQLPRTSSAQNANWNASQQPHRGQMDNPRRESPVENRIRSPAQRYQDERTYQVPMQPPQRPFVNEQPVRRSMDDDRQMALRQGSPSGPSLNGSTRGAWGPSQMPQRDDAGREMPAPDVWSDVQQRAPSAPPLRQGLQSPPGMSIGTAPLTQQRSNPEQQQPRSANPAASTNHPVPVRPGLDQRTTPQAARPPPVRNYANASPSPSTPIQPPASQPHQRKVSTDHFAQPVTHAELDRLRANVENAPMNFKIALVLVKKLVEAGNTLASEGGRADARTAGKNRERYWSEAYKRLKKLVTQAYPDAQFYLADCHGQGLLGLEIDPKEAFSLYQAAAKAGHPEAAYRTAVCCEMGAKDGGGTAQDFPKAVQWYRRAAALGDTSAMYKIGVVLLKGLMGQPRNISEAVNFLKRAAERADRDHPHALNELATLYESSNTHPEVRNKIVADDAYALELYQRAADLGYKFSQFRLGQAYEYGTLGLVIDNRASITWYTKAAAQGEHQAELALSGWYLTGADGILEHNDTEAYLWARKAAQSEPPLAKAMFAMGYFTETGIGCPASLDEAKRWYGRAAAYKFPKALERLEEIKRNGGKGARPPPGNGKLTRKDQKHDESECTIM